MPAMLRGLKDLFDSLVPAASESAEREQHAVQLAAAVLLVEVMRSDAEIGTAERRAVVAALGEHFALAAVELERLLELALETSRQATDYYSFTSRINQGFDAAQKLRMVEQMWRVAYADGRLDAHENHLMHKLGELLYIPHGEYIAAKMRAKQAAGDPSP